MHRDKHLTENSVEVLPDVVREVDCDEFLAEMRGGGWRG